MKSKNIKWHEGEVDREKRSDLFGFQNKVLWFTGLSGSGKSTLAREVEKQLYEKDILTYVLDGDNIRHGLNSDLGFSPEDREENIRRIGEVSRLFYDAGILVLVCFISPYRKDRNRVREIIGEDFVEIFMKCSLEEAEQRDPKGLYKKARQGMIKEFTGISAPYEEPETPELIIDTEQLNVKQSAEKIIDYLDL